jgi:hypothetical protein
MARAMRIVRPLHAARKRTAIVCLGDEMEMIALHGEVH